MFELHFRDVLGMVSGCSEDILGMYRGRLGVCFRDVVGMCLIFVLGCIGDVFGMFWGCSLVSSCLVV